MKLRIAITFISILSSIISMSASGSLSSYKGVWASDSAEAVITDSVCILFEKKADCKQAYISIPSKKLSRRTIFRDSLATTSNVSPLEISTESGRLVVGAHKLSKVEDIELTEPYDMSPANSKFNIGPRLQEWRLGVKYDSDDNAVYCEINTNRHMFVYMVIPSMTYIRAAAARNNDKGTLFFQNIRMMKNNNTGEYTAIVMPKNFDIASRDLEIDNSKFKSDGCTFCPDGGIYWSLISFTPDTILLNGCGETYTINRPTKSTPLIEWIKFKPYTK